MGKHSPFGIYLAAGSSSRFGSDKLNQHIRGKPLGSLALETALKSDIQEVIAITRKSDTPWLKPFLKDKKCTQVTCPNAHLGQAQSIQCGLHYAEEYHAESIIIMLADQPFITVDMIQALAVTYDTTKNVTFVASRHNGIICPPILFSHHMYPDLYKLKGDHGAKYLLTEKAAEGTFIDFPYRQPFFDIDTKMDYEYVVREG